MADVKHILFLLTIFECTVRALVTFQPSSSCKKHEIPGETLNTQLKTKYFNCVRLFINPITKDWDFAQILFKTAQQKKRISKPILARGATHEYFVIIIDKCMHR